MMQRDSPAYRAQCAIRLDGGLDVAALKAALRQAVLRHEILRTSFYDEPGLEPPIQVIADEGAPSWQLTDLSGLGREEQERRVEALLRQEGAAPFDFGAAPLMRLRLVTLSASEHVLLICLPALCADHWSLRNLAREVGRLYEGCLKGGAPPVEPTQYVRFSEWQNELLEGEEADAAAALWSEPDAGNLAALQLPFENHAHEGAGADFKLHAAPLGPDVLARVEALARALGVPVSAFMQACWVTLLWRHARQPEVVVGMACHGRKYEELHDALGLFARYVPVRCRLEADMEFGEVLAQVGECARQAEEWQEYWTWDAAPPGVRATGPRAQRPDYFSACFEFDEGAAVYAADGVRFTVKHEYACFDRFALKLRCVRHGDGAAEALRAEFHYDPERVSAEAVARLAEQYLELAESAAADTRSLIGELRIVSRPERDRLLVEFNRTEREYDSGKPVHQLFEEQAERTPRRVALVSEEARLTYAELNERANQLAHHLRQLGVGPETVVGLCLERSHRAVVGLLGILKAGGAYLPLDAGQPGRRLDSMLKQAGSTLVVTQSGLAGSFAGTGASVVCLDAEADAISRRGRENPPRTASARNLVYVIFTSGSTGGPKGVGVEHRQLTNYVQAVIESAELPEGASYATVSSLAADLGNTVIFPALCAGGALHVVSYERATDAVKLGEYFSAHGIDCLKITPSHLEALLASAGAESVLPRRRLLLGGEASRRAWVREVQRAAPGCLVYNHYGPTETTVGALVHRVGHELRAPGGPMLALGRPLGNVQVYVLDAQMRPVAAGETGELYIGGAGVTRGYVGRAAQTAERYVPNPFGERPGARLYRTGDLARHLPDGNVEFLGRADHQVKIRGHRIELNEIEHALAEHPAVRQCVVVAGEAAGGGDRRLVAYVVGPDGARDRVPAAAEFRDFLRERLPDYMVPSAFVTLDELPLTANGKVDRKALPAPEEVKAVTCEVSAEPRTPVEGILVNIWSEVLRKKGVGIHDNFFDLGGHSLLATRLISRVRDAFAVELPLRSLFESPTVAGLAECISGLMRAGHGAEAPPLGRVERSAPPPLSFAQQRLWFLDRLEPANPFYNCPLAARLSGRLDRRALGRALAGVVARHEALRTTFALDGADPVQLVAPAQAPALPIIDLRGVAPADREEHARRLAEEEAARPFDLERGPLLRAALLRLSGDEHLLLLTLHHIVSDGWSMGVLVRELSALYSAFSQGLPSPLAPLSIQYADYAAWQRRWLEGESLERLLDYWRRQLGGAPPAIELPADRPRPPVQSYRGAAERFVIAPAVADGLKELGRSRGATLFMTLLAAFDVLLWRYTGSDDLVVGTPVAGRTRSEVEGLVGFFVNTLALRARVEGRESFEGLLARVREATLGAYAHQELPFERLVEELRPERDLSRTPLVQVVFSLQNTPPETIELGDLSFSIIATHSETAKFDLILDIRESAHGLRGCFYYNTDLFDHETVSRMAEHYNKLLERILNDPQQPVATYSILTEAERRRLLSGATRAHYPQGQTIHEIFQAQAARTPDAAALTYEGEHYTYARLNARANQVARRLRALGVGPESRVGVLMERSPEMVAALLGVLKAGGAYLPLDPAYPAERLRVMAESSGIRALLVAQPHLAAGWAGPAVPVVCLGGGTDDELEGYGEEDFESGATAHNLAYVIYTSGSTGAPKGIMVSHHEVGRLFEATRPWFNFDERDTWTFFHSYAFDFSVWEMWGALLHGGRLVVVPYLVSRSPETFYDLLRAEQVTVLNQTPSAFRQLIRAEESTDAGRELSLRLIIFGGEALELQSLKPWFDRHGDAHPQLVNMYGITETTVHVTYRPLTAADAREGVGSVIGEPIPDLQVYLLDAYAQPVPTGVTGEMYVGGAGLARGYDARPELTAERFVPDPFSAEPGARLYRTGDLARRLRSGELEYLGRADHQVKVRGFRIEPQEIEAALSAHPSVRQALVMARGEGGDRRLVAYVVAGGAAGQAPEADALRDFLKGRLPDYMVPSAFVALDELPLTENGKVDRKALPEPAPSRPLLEQAFVAARTPAEQTLAEIWGAVLGIEEPGVHDNFFALGGDSIRSIQVMSLAKERGLSFSLQQLFQHQTIHELAREIGVADAPPAVAPADEPFALVRAEDRPKLPAGLEDAYPLTMLQAGMLYHMRLTHEAPVYHNVDSLHLRGPFEPARFREAAEQVVARHAVLRTSFDLTTYSEPLQLVHERAQLQIGVEDLRHLPARERERVVDAFVDAERKNSFDLSRPPLLRFYIHRLTDEAFQFTLTECHAILDGWSLQSTLAELFSIYLGLLGKEAPAPEKPVTAAFRDFVKSEREALESEDCRRFWADKLSGCTVMQLPRWNPSTRHAKVQRKGVKGVTNAILPAEVVEGLGRLARSAGVSLKSVFLAAHVKVLSLVGGGADVLTGLTSNGRLEEHDGERVRGLFLNLVPLRLKVQDGTWTELVRAVFEAERELLPFRRYPLAALQKEWGEQPLLETAFNYVHFHVVDEVMRSGHIEILGFKKSEHSNFALQAHFHNSPITSSIRLGLEYDTAKLHEEQVEAVEGYYLAALKAMADNPLARHGSQTLLSPAEQHRILSEWNDTRVAYPQNVCVHELIEAQARRTPDAAALAYEGEHYTYAQLNARANRLARHLRRLGVGPESRVGVLMERSAEMVVALLGTLKAGGAYLPLDPAYPAERLRLMAESSGIRALVAQPHLAGVRPATEAPVVCLGGGTDDELEGYGEEDFESGAGPENLAYVIYTSGSTGTPKGVMNTHAGLCNRLLWMQDAYALTPDDRVLQKTPFTFDVSVWEFFWPLMTGARLVVARPGGHQDRDYLARVIADEGITVLHFVPSMLQMFLEGQGPAGCQSLRRVISSGEALPAELQQQFFERMGAQLSNLYGPTEAAIDVTYWDCERDDQRDEVPIGRPIANIQIHVLDEHLRPVPVGVAGELYIGGVGLARGYDARPELTAERFVPDPFSAEPGARLYRTGDLARRLRGGELEYLGRADHQVKLRGFRIELGEIEAALAAHPAVGQALVTARGEGGDRRLVAYVVGPDGARDRVPAAAEFRDFLRERLPDYMVPSAFVTLDELPLTANGKVDRKALPEPAPSRPLLESSYAPPQTERERVIAEVWQEVLQLEKVGIHDNFFDLGGHSILMLQVHGKLQELFGGELSMVEMFEHPTVSQLAKYLGQDSAAPLEESHARAETRKASRNRQRRQRAQNPAPRQPESLEAGNEP